jgi:hypothetical protein
MGQGNSQHMGIDFVLCPDQDRADMAGFEARNITLWQVFERSKVNVLIYLFEAVGGLLRAGRRSRMLGDAESRRNPPARPRDTT